MARGVARTVACNIDVKLRNAYPSMFVLQHSLRLGEVFENRQVHRIRDMRQVLIETISHELANAGW